jgi:hypothetical protein
VDGEHGVAVASKLEPESLEPFQRPCMLEDGNFHAGLPNGKVGY